MSPVEFGQLVMGGGASAFNRNILLLDDMEGTFKWTIAGTGSDFAGTKETSSAYTGVSGMKLITKVTTPAVNDYCEASRYFCYGPGRRMEVRCRIGIPIVGVVLAVDVTVRFETLAGRYVAALRLDLSGVDTMYWGSAGSWVNTGQQAPEFVDGMWFILRMTLDMVDMEYIDLLLRGTRVDLEDVEVARQSSQGNQWMQLLFRVTADGAAQAQVDIDDVIVAEYDVV